LYKEEQAGCLRSALLLFLRYFEKIYGKWKTFSQNLRLIGCNTKHNAAAGPAVPTVTGIPYPHNPPHPSVRSPEHRRPSRLLGISKDKSHSSAKACLLRRLQVCTELTRDVSVAGRPVPPRPKKAIQSLRLRLHSGLRQSGTAFGPGSYGMAEAMPLTKQCHSKLFARFDFTPGAA
jgi:hypothetical protein